MKFSENNFLKLYEWHVIDFSIFVQIVSRN